MKEILIIFTPCQILQQTKGIQKGKEETYQFTQIS